MKSDSARQKNRLVVVLIALLVFALLACLGLIGYLMLPGLATRYLPAQQIRQLGFADFQGRITRIGPFQAAAGPFRFGDGDRPTMSIGSVRIDYSPVQLSRKRIRRLRMDDLTIHALLGPDGIRLPGLEWDAPDRGEPGGPLASGPDGSIATIEIRSARVILTWRQQTYRIPFDADIQPQGNDLAKLTARVNLFPGDQRLSVTARVDLEKGRGDVFLDGTAIHLDRFADLFHQFSHLDFTGSLDLGAEAGFRMNPFTVSDVRFRAAWRRGRLALGVLSILPAATDTAAIFSAESADAIKWQVEASGLQVQDPVPVAVPAVRAAMDFGGEAPTIDGQMDLVILPFSRPCPWPVALETELPLPLDFGIRGKPAGRWTAICHTTAGSVSALPTGELVLEGGRFTFGAPRIRLGLNGENQTVDGHWQLDFGPIEATIADMQARLPSMQGKGAMRFGDQDSDAVFSTDARLTFPGATVSGNGLSGGVGAAVLSARLHPQAGLSAGVSGRLQVNDGRLHHGPSNVGLSGLSLDLPYASGPVPTQDPGTLSIDRIRYGNLILGGFQGRISREPGALVLAAEHASVLFPKMAAGIKGRVNLAGSAFPEASVQINLPAYDLPADFDLGRLQPDLEGVVLAGRVSARGLVSVSANGLSGAVDMDLKGGRLDIARQRITVEGIDTALHFPELPQIRSAPAQSLAFERAAMGRVVVDGGRVDFQVESPDTVLVEKGRLHWCGGKVDAQSLRLTTGKQAYALSLYCQRLGLSRILEQLGSVNARGSGTVNGRIPVTVDSGRIRFDDGFLFSTPGEPGKIRLTGTDILIRGIAAGTPQFAQVDLAREALKDYDYEWAKLGMNTEGETLVMRLQFDGKPARPLPFVFQREIGSFVRVKAGEQGSIFQGVGLDVNLRLPLDQLLEYKDVVDMLD